MRCLAQKSAGLIDRGTEAVILRVVKGKNATQVRFEAALDRLWDQRLLVLLLRLVGAAVETMNGAPVAARPVGGASVPSMRVHHYDCSCPTRYKLFLRMNRLQIGQFGLR